MTAPPSVAVVIRCADLPSALYDCVSSLARQSRPAGAIVIASDASTPEVSRPWLDAMAARIGAGRVHVADSRAAAVHDCGVRSVPSDYVLCLDAGDRLAPDALKTLATVLDDDATVDLVTSAWVLIGPGDRSTVMPPAPVTMAALLAEPPAPHGASLVRRSAWEALGGLDPEAGPLQEHEFVLRLVSSGRPALAVHDACVTRRWRADAVFVRQWDAQGRARAIGHIVDRHATVYREDPAAVLHGREAALLDLAGRYDALITRHREALADAARLRQAIADVGESGNEHAIDFGDLRRVSPVDRDWGYSRGDPLDRYYIERFLARHAGDVRGVVLEVQEASYTQRFGGGRVTRSDVLDISPANPVATVLTDLRCAANVADGTYDCVILTQTAHVIDDMAAVMSECARILRPGGVLLATFPAASRVCVEYGTGGDHWRLTVDGVRALCESAFPPAAIEVTARGNVLATTAFLHGLAGHELAPDELDASDPRFPLVIAARATRTPITPTTLPRRGVTEPRVLLHHRVAAPDTDAYGMCSTPDAFEAQVQQLARTARVMPLVDLVEASLAGEDLRGAVALTFDDGYVDNLRVAAPILVGLGLPATFFVTTEGLPGGHVFWWDVLEHALLRPVPSAVAHPTVRVAGERIDVDVSTPEARRATHHRVYAAIVGLPEEERDAVVEPLRSWAGVTSDDLPRRMTADEIRALASMPGLSIGAHTVKHLMLPRQVIEVRRDEVSRSRADLEALLQQPVVAFAYPFGADDDPTVALVRDAGFTLAVACDAPGATFRDRWRIPRVGLGRW